MKLDKKIFTNIPKLRFPGFGEEWEVKKISDTAEINPPNDNLPSNFYYIDLESVNAGVLSVSSLINFKDAPGRAQRLLTRGDILFQMVRPYQQNNLYFNEDGDFVASTGYAQIRAKNNKAFLYQLVHTKKFLDEVLDRCTGSSYPAINSNDLKKISIKIPKEEEQKKIADFLTSVDSWIENLKKQKENLELYKKGMMQKIFSQEIRFKDEGGKGFAKWENRKLGEIDVTVSDGNYGEMYPKSDEMKQVGIPFIRANNLHNLKIIWDEMKFIDMELHKLLLSGHLQKNDILVTTRGDIGILAYVEKEFEGANINAQICLLRCGSKMFARYLLGYLSSVFAQKQFIELQTGSALKQLPKSNLAKIKIPVPVLDEQIKIADFLSSIDNMIELKQMQITEAENWKKGLMQKLFV